MDKNNSNGKFFVSKWTSGINDNDSILIELVSFDIDTIVKPLIMD